MWLCRHFFKMSISSCTSLRAAAFSISTILMANMTLASRCRALYTTPYALNRVLTQTLPKWLKHYPWPSFSINSKIFSGSCPVQLKSTSTWILWLRLYGALTTSESSSLGISIEVAGEFLFSKLSVLYYTTKISKKLNRYTFKTYFGFHIFYSNEVFDCLFKYQRYFLAWRRARV